jgi:secreted PhoX family phosphatase
MNKILSLILLSMFALTAYAQQTITVQIGTASDDLEEWIAGPGQTKVVGSMDAGSSDLELGTEAANNADPQVVGVRFTGIAIPKGALITKAYLQFQVDATNKNTDPCNIWIKAQDSDNPLTFETTPFNITSRSYLKDSIFWGIPTASWSTVGQNGADQRSTNIASLVQQLIDRAGWTSGNSMVFTLQGTGLRESESYDGLPAGAAKLIVEFIPLFSFTTQVAAADDDQEEWVAGPSQSKTVGTLDAGSSDLELGTEAANNGDPQVVGIRFVDLTIPKGSLIKSAKIQFQVDATAKNTDPCNIWIKTQWDANPATFNPSVPFNITSRPTSPDSVNWAIPAGSWSTVGQNGADQATSDLSSLVQAMVNRSDWNSGNAMAFFLRGTGLREAESFDGLPAGAAKLIIEYVPVATSTYQVSAAEDDLEEWIAGPGQTKVVGSMDAGSSDLELGTEAANNGDPQVVGVRFRDIKLPQGAIIQKAYLQFQVDATNKNTDPCNIWVKAEASDNPVSYATTPFNITSRTYTQDSVSWAIPAGSWTTVGQSGPDQRSSNIAPLVQALVNRAGWASGNAMAFTLQGTGLRESESYDGLPAGAAKLIIEYLGGGGGPMDPKGNVTTAYPVKRKESWSYLDKGLFPGANWTSQTFNDTTWAFGPAPLGYGTSSLGTTVSFGSDANAKHITTYFRKRITIADAAALPAQLELQVRHDDGVVIYVNGTEVKRVNMAAGAVSNTTLASADLTGNRELAYVTFDVPKTAFVTGENVIAAEVHQFAANNNDLVFDLSFVNPVGVSNPTALGCVDPNDKHIACFTSLMPRLQNEIMEIPSATHAFQYITFTGVPYTIGSGNTPSNFDFTGFVPANGTDSRKGHLSINHELSVGAVSILDIGFDNATGLWKVDSSGGVDFSVVAGTQQNCSGTVTPWGTVITCEEDAPTSGDKNNDGYLDYGWAVEIDPLTRKVKDYGNGPAKLWALGRMEHENVVVVKDRKTLYEGEDNPTGNVYKFVADNADNLSKGKLYVLKLDQPLVNGEPTGTTGTWVLVPNSTPQECNTVKQFAATNGTPFNGVEDVEINPLTGDIYFAVKGLSRTYSFKDDGTTLSGFKTFVGGKSYRVTIGNEVVTEDWGSGNDNLTFDDRGNLWILQDGGNNYVWIVRPDHTQANPKVEIFMQTPIGSEPTGMTFTPDYRYMFISIQEPSNSNNEPVSDVTGNAQFFNRSTAIVISRNDFLGTKQQAAAQLKGLGDWTTTPVFTIGETLGGYTPPGILDGVGARKLADGTVRAYINSELGQSAGYTYTLANGTALKGGRVSYFDIDPATKQVSKAGLAYKAIVDRAGKVVTSATQINEGTNTTNGIDRLCSASLFKAGQFGLVDDIFFTGEETGDGQEFALDVNTDTLWCLPWLGRAAWENVTLIESGNPSKVAILVGDDRAGAPLLLYVGNKNAKNDGSFLDRNGLDNGKLYVWAADNGDLSVQQFNGTGNSRTGKFKEIAYYNLALAGTTGYDALGFATQAKQDELGDAVGAFSFSRPEDLATNPANGRQVVLASTGRDPEFPADKWGTTYIMDFNTTDLANVTAKVSILYAGDDAGKGQFAGPDFGMRSPDNLDWSKNGLIYVQEDRSFSGFGKESGQEASVWEVNPASGQLTRIGQIDRSAVPAGQTDAAPADLGNWESSGITDVSDLFGATNEVVFLAVTQAHSLGGGPIAANTLAEGGQLCLVSGPLKCKLELRSNYAACTGDTVKIQTPLNFAGFQVGAQQVKSLSYTQPGVYTVEATTVNGCSSKDTVTVNIVPLPVISLPPTITSCANITNILDAGNAGATYKWSTGALTQTITVNISNTYSVTVTTAEGCSATDNTVLTINPNPVADLGKDTTICTTQTPFTLSVGTYSVYRWSTGVATPTIQVSASDTYVVTVTDANGCTDVDEVVVTVKTCSGTKQPSLTGAFKVFPNPTDGLVNLEMLEFEPGDYRVTVFNVQGQLVHTEKVNISSDRNITPIDLSEFSKGTYLFKVASDKGVLVRRVIVQE